MDGGKQWGKTLNSVEHPGSAEGPTRAFGCRVLTVTVLRGPGTQLASARSAPTAPLTPNGDCWILNCSRTSCRRCRQLQALFIFLYLTNCSSESELFKADSPDSFLKQRGTQTHRWWLQFSPAHGVSQFPSVFNWTISAIC